MGRKRNWLRSRSGAAEACPHCGKKLMGAKGLKAHLAAMHQTAAAPSSGPSGHLLPVGAKEGGAS